MSPTRAPANPLQPATGIVLLCLAGACMILGPSEAGDPRASSGGGALDKILLSEKSNEAGSLVFDHRLHYAPRGEGGEAIGCKSCHHDDTGSKDDPPRACGDCHISHSDARLGVLPSL